MPQVAGGGGYVKPPKPPKPSPTRARENAQNEAQAAGASGAGSHAVTAGPSRTPGTRTIAPRPGGGVTQAAQQAAVQIQREGEQEARQERRERRQERRERRQDRRNDTDAGSVRTGAGGGGGGGLPQHTGGTSGGGGGGGTGFHQRSFGRPDTTVDGNRPPGATFHGYGEGLDVSSGGTGAGGEYFGGGGGEAGGGGGGGAAGSNPIGGVSVGKGTNVEEYLQAQGARKTRKQRQREKTY